MSGIDFKNNECEIEKQKQNNILDKESNTELDPEKKGNLKFIDKDNYKRYTNIKSKSALLTVLTNQYFWALYSVIVIGLFIIESLKVIPLLKEYLITIGNFANIDLTQEINWGFILIPLIVYTIYKSFNSYSMIKISF